MKIAIVAPRWGRETTSDQTYLVALARALSEHHAVRILTGPEPAEPPRNPTSRPGLAAVTASLPPPRPTESATSQTAGESGRAPQPEALCESDRATPSLDMVRVRAHAVDRLPRWFAGSALGRPVLRWALGHHIEAQVEWADAVIVPDGADALALAAAQLARVAGKLTLLPRTAEPVPAPVDPALARAAGVLLTATRAGARALVARGWSAERVAITGLVAEASVAADPAAFRRRYRVAGPFVLYAGEIGDAGYELIRNTVGLVWHKRPEATFVFVSATRGGRRNTRTSHSGHMLHLAGLDEVERGSAIAAASLVCVAGPLPATGAAVADAWFRGRPVVATDSAAARELLADGTAGCLTPADAHELAAAMLRLITDPAMADRLGSEGQRRLREQHAPVRLAALIAERIQPARTPLAALALDPASDFHPPPVPNSVSANQGARPAPGLLDPALALAGASRRAGAPPAEARAR